MDDQFPKPTAVFPRDPMIKLQISALGILCFNQRLKRAEIGFLKVKDHGLTITIVDSKGKYVLCPTEITAKTLRLTSTKRDVGEVYYKNGDPENFKVMYDLTELYSRNSDFKPKLEFLAKLFIHDAVFSTDPSGIFRARPFRQNNPSMTLPVRTVGKTLNVFTKTRNVSFYIGSKKIELNPRLSYNIIIRTTGCRKTVAAESDFKYYYTLLKNAGSVQYNLKPATQDMTWFADFEIEEFEKLGKELLNFFARKRDKATSEKERREIVSKLENLTEIMSCPPVGCVMATIPHKSRSLP